MPESVPEAVVKRPPPERWLAPNAVARAMANPMFGSGPMADLRRLDPDGPLVSAPFHRLLAAHVPPERTSGSSIRDWALLVHVLALVKPESYHGDRLGREMQAADVSEARFSSLLAASREQLGDLLPRVVRLIDSRGKRISVGEVHDLIFIGEAYAPELHAKVRQRIASDYYRAEFAGSKGAAADAVDAVARASDAS